MSEKTALVIVALIMSALAGCEPTPDPGGGLHIDLDTPLEARGAADVLGMRVVELGRRSVTFQDAENVVVVFIGAGSRAFVNSVVVGSGGGFIAGDGRIMLPGHLVADIHQALRPTPPTAPVQPPVRPQPRENPAGLRPLGVVVLDPGHGGHDPGTTSVHGVHEKDFVLPLSRLVATELRAMGATVVMTRNSDVFVELEERAAIANRHDADLFVSIHADWAPNSAAHGHTLYVSRDSSAASRAAAEAIDARLSRVTAASRGVRQANFRVLVHAETPAVLVEAGYMSNRAESARLGQPGYQLSLARAIAWGIADQLQRR